MWHSRQQLQALLQMECHGAATQQRQLMLYDWEPRAMQDPPGHLKQLPRGAVQLDASEAAQDGVILELALVGVRSALLLPAWWHPPPRLPTCMPSAGLVKSCQSGWSWASCGVGMILCGGNCRPSMGRALHVGSASRQACSRDQEPSCLRPSMA